MFIVGLDLSLTATGICVIDHNGNVIKTAVVGSSLKRTARVKEKVERLIEIATKIVNTVNGFIEDGVKPHVSIENYAFAARGAQNDLGELHGVVKSQLWLGCTIEPVMVPTLSARKTVFGKGNIPKKDVLPTLDKSGKTFYDHNIADAYVVAEHVRKSLIESKELNDDE